MYLGKRSNLFDWKIEIKTELVRGDRNQLIAFLHNLNEYFIKENFEICVK